MNLYAVKLQTPPGSLVILLTAASSLTGMRPSAVKQAVISSMASLGINVVKSLNPLTSFLIAVTKLIGQATHPRLTLSMNAVTIAPLDLLRLGERVNKFVNNLMHKVIL